MFKGSGTGLLEPMSPQVESLKYREKETPKESQKNQNRKCCRLGLIEPFGR